MKSLEQAKAHVEKILLRWSRIVGDRADECEIITWSLEDCPSAGFRIAEITWSATGGPDDSFIRGGASIMQSDLPEGLASCATVERWIIGLMLNDAQLELDSKRDFLWLSRPRESPTQVMKAAQAAQDAALGDSNDAEIDLLREALEEALHALGLTLPVGREPDDE